MNSHLAQRNTDDNTEREGKAARHREQVPMGICNMVQYYVHNRLNTKGKHRTYSSYLHPTLNKRLDTILVEPRPSTAAQTA